MNKRSLTTRIWANMNFITSKISRRSAQTMFGDEGMSVAQIQLLRFIVSNEGMTQMQISESLVMSKGNTSQLLSKLEHCDFVRKEKIGTANLIYATHKGKDLMREVTPQFEALLVESMNGLDEDEQRELVRLLGKLRRGLK